jgi:hypothetical protein
MQNIKNLHSTTYSYMASFAAVVFWQRISFFDTVSEYYFMYIIRYITEKILHTHKTSAQNGYKLIYLQA